MAAHLETLHWAPAKCKVFLWLAVRNRCWTADQLAKRNLPHLSLCPLCDQAEETIQHLLTSCVFAREFWFRILSPVGLQRCVPDNRDQEFAGWWRKAAKQVPKEKKKGFNTLVILGAWLLWKHRNSCVFEGTLPSIHALLQTIGDDRWVQFMVHGWSIKAQWITRKIVGLGCLNIYSSLFDQVLVMYITTPTPSFIG